MKSCTSKRVAPKEKTRKIISGWNKLTKRRLLVQLKDQEKAQFDKASFAEEQVKKSKFVLGGQINRKLERI